MKKDYTDITFVLDRSGSMESIWSDVEGGINSFIEVNKALPGNVKFTLLVFDSNNGNQLCLDTVINSVDICQLGRINLSDYRPRGGTPLHDAMGVTINRLGQRLASLPKHERPDKVLFVTYTDGKENASKEFKNNIKHLVERQSNQYSWEFVYMGTNQDVHTVGEELGIPVGNRLFYACNAVGVANSVQKLSSSCVSYRVGNTVKGNYFGSVNKDNQ